MRMKGSLATFLSIGVLTCLVAAKIANVGVPLVLKQIVDALDLKPGDPRSALVVPVALLVAYGLLRVSVTLFTELREFLFYPVAARIARRVSLEAFEHLLSLSLRFHLERQTGGVSRDIERGSKAIHSLLNYTIYNILPTLVEMALVISLLSAKFDGWFAAITLGALALYIAFTVSVTEWRTHFRRAMNEQDSKASTRAVDALLNYETVKVFGNEAFERSRYDENLQRLEQASVKSQTSLSLLNLGQSLIIAAAVVLLVWRATLGVVEGSMTLGDLVLVNALMIQLYVPLNFLGVLYREIKQSTIDMEKMFALLGQHREVADAPDAPPLQQRGGGVRFENVRFGYDVDREILHGVSFEIPAGKTVAVVGPSGSCVLHVKEHVVAGHDFPPVYELCEFLTDVLKISRLDARFPHRVGLHNSCHGLRELRLGRSSERMEPDFSHARRLLQMVSGLQLVDLSRPDECCGFGGTFAVGEEAVSCMMGDDRIADHERAGAEVITAGDMSCLMHLDGLLRRQKKPLRVMHIAEILAGRARPQ